jgi:hypothetical protein
MFLDTTQLATPPAVLASEFRAGPPPDQTVVLLRITFTAARWKKRLTNSVPLRTARDIENLLIHELRW